MFDASVLSVRFDFKIAINKIFLQGNNNKIENTIVKDFKNADDGTWTDGLEAKDPSVITDGTDKTLLNEIEFKIAKTYDETKNGIFIKERYCTNPADREHLYKKTIMDS